MKLFFLSTIFLISLSKTVFAESDKIFTLNVDDKYSQVKIQEIIFKFISFGSSNGINEMGKPCVVDNYFGGDGAKSPHNPIESIIIGDSTVRDSVDLNPNFTNIKFYTFFESKNEEDKVVKAEYNDSFLYLRTLDSDGVKYELKITKNSNNTKTVHIESGMFSPLIATDKYNCTILN